MLKAQGIHEPFGLILRLTWVGYFAALVLPGAAGGDELQTVLSLRHLQPPGFIPSLVFEIGPQAFPDAGDGPVGGGAEGKRRQGDRPQRREVGDARGGPVVHGADNTPLRKPIPAKAPTRQGTERRKRIGV